MAVASPSLPAVLRRRSLAGASLGSAETIGGVVDAINDAGSAGGVTRLRAELSGTGTLVLTDETAGADGAQASGGRRRKATTTEDGAEAAPKRTRRTTKAATAES